MLLGSMDYFKNQEDNLVLALRMRQTNGGVYRGSNSCFCRRLHVHVLPNVTVANIEKPAVSLYRFTPDGQKLIAVDSNRLKLIVYLYKGVTSAGSLLHTLYPVVLCNPNEYNSSHIRSNIFDRLFTELFSTQVVSGVNGEKLCRDFCLITNDCKHAVLAASVTRTPEQATVFSELRQNNESLQLSNTMPLEDVTIIVVDLVDGHICDKKQFKVDKITVNPNHCVYLYDRLLSVLSVQHQTIHIYQICHRSGALIPVQQIGRFLYDDDQLLVDDSSLVSQGPLQTASHRRVASPTSERVFTGLKQRLLAFQYRKAVSNKDSRIDFGTVDCPVRLFHAQFDFYKTLKIAKMQMIDSDHFLFRWMSEKCILGSLDGMASLASIFMVYNWRDTSVVQVYDSDSLQLMDAFLSDVDAFRHPDEVSFPCSSSNCDAARQLFNRYERTIYNAKGFKPHELPISAQSYCTSPYLDLNLFSYDEKLISMQQRPKLCADQTIRFFSRRSSKLLFSIHQGNANGERVLLTFIVHPTDPLIISIHRDHRNYPVSLHINAYQRGADDQNWINH